MVGSPALLRVLPRRQRFRSGGQSSDRLDRTRGGVDPSVRPSRSEGLPGSRKTSRRAVREGDTRATLSALRVSHGAPIARDLTRTTLAVLCLGVLIGASTWVLRPFLPALVWATMLVVATWPVMRRVQTTLGGSRPLAVLVMTLALVVVFAVPLLLAIQTIVDAAPDLIEWSRTAAGLTVPAPPGWLRKLPLVGVRLAERWEEIAALQRGGELSERLAPYVRPGVLWFVGQVGSLGLVFVHVLLTGVLATILYARGEAAVAGLIAFARRLARP